MLEVVRTRTEPVRVLQVLDSLGMGGAETWLMEVLRQWHRTQAAHMDFLLTSGRRAIFDDDAEQLGANLYYVKFSRRSVTTFAREFRRILGTGNYDAIHDHSDYGSGWHYLAGSGLLPPIRITHLHNAARNARSVREINPSRRLAAWAGHNLVSRFATNIAATSRQVIGDYGFDRPGFRRIPKQVLHCGFDPSRFLFDRMRARDSVRREFGWPPSSTLILVVGRIDHSPEIGHPHNQKNSAFALSVAMECARRDDGVRVLFAGEPGPAVPVLRQRITAAGFEARICFAGIRGDIEKLMAASDALLFPSTGEGLGMVAVEAQAAGLPVLASTAVPREAVVVPELVRFRSLSTPVSEWADDLLPLCCLPRDPERANARVSASPFAIQYSADALLNLYSGSAPWADIPVAGLEPVNPPIRQASVHEPMNLSRHQHGATGWPG